VTRRTVIVTTSYPRYEGDPSGHFVATEARALVASGEEVLILAPGAGPSTDEPPKVLWIPDGGCFGWPGALQRLRERPSRALGACSFAVRARRSIRRLRPDRIIAHWTLPSAFPIAFGVGPTLEVVAHGTDVRLLEGLPGGRRLARMLVRTGAEWRFVSHDMRERFERLAGRALPNAVVLPARIDLSLTPDREAARFALGIPGAARLAVIVSRLVPDKRVDRALIWALERKMDVVVIGDGPLEGSLRSAFPQVRYTGLLPRPKALTWIAAADALFTASRHEGASSVVREARALGVRVIAAASGDLAAMARSDSGIELLDG
jgi:glycosyltransferase involved in cell wall biosynthesis